MENWGGEEGWKVKREEGEEGGTEELVNQELMSSYHRS